MLYNPFAAVPSMHVAFALMIAVPAMVLVRNRVRARCVGFYPLVVTCVVVVTANHFWIDAALGAIVAAVSAVAASRPSPGLVPKPGPGARARPRSPPEQGGGAPPRRTRAPRRGRGRGELRAAVRDRLIESRLTPNTISLTGFVLNLVAAALITQEHFVLAGVRLHHRLGHGHARRPLLADVGQGHVFGAFLDSTLDRIEEGVVLAAVAAYYAKQGEDVIVGARCSPWWARYMVSYTRARAEALGVECKVGIASRAVRVVILSAGLMFAAGETWEVSICSSRPCTTLAALTIFTTFQRVFHVRRELIRRRSPCNPGPSRVRYPGPRIGAVSLAAAGGHS